MQNAHRNDKLMSLLYQDGVFWINNEDDISCLPAIHHEDDVII